MKDCVFCRIVCGEIPSQIVYRDKRCFAIHDIKPTAPLHLLIIPQRHITSLESSEGMAGHLLAVASKLAIREGVDRTGYRLVVNYGPDSGQEVAHLHVHLLAGRRMFSMG